MVARIEEKERELSRLKEFNARRVEEGKEFLAEVGQKNFIVNMKMDFFIKQNMINLLCFCCVFRPRRSPSVTSSSVWRPRLGRRLKSNGG